MAYARQRDNSSATGSGTISQPKRPRPFGGNWGRSALAHYSREGRRLTLQPAGLCDGVRADAGAVVSGAPPTEMDPSGFVGRANRLRANPDTRA